MTKAGREARSFWCGFGGEWRRSAGYTK